MIPTQRVDLPGGAWAIVATRLSYGARREIRRALADFHAGDPDGTAEGRLVLALVQTWSDELGDRTLDGIDAIDAETVDALFSACLAAFRKADAPLGKVDGTSQSSPVAGP